MPFLKAEHNSAVTLRTVLSVASLDPHASLPFKFHDCPSAVELLVTKSSMDKMRPTPIQPSVSTSVSSI